MSAMPSRQPPLFPAWLLAGMLCPALMALAAPALADGGPLYVGDVEPHYYRQSVAGHGLFYDMVQELSLLADRTGTILALPLARELEMVRRDPRAIGVLARMPERESSYTWLCPLLTEEVMLIADAHTRVDISTLDAARKLRIGALRGSPSESTARTLGFQHIEAVAHAEDNARKLAVGRIDALLSLRFVAAYGQQRAGLSLARLRYGAVVTRFDFFLAGSPQLDKAEADNWRNACALLRRQGSYERLLHKYRFMPVDSVPTADAKSAPRP